MFLLWTASSLFPLLAPAPALAADTQFLHGHIPAVVAKLNLQPVARMPGTNHLNLAMRLLTVSS
jgi:hypothetical protein